MYTTTNYKTKTALKLAIKNGEQVTVYQPYSDVFNNAPPAIGSVDVFLEGPHYPKPHTWYAQGKLVNGVLVSVK